jgi:hypothetical protein
LSGIPHRLAAAAGALAAVGVGRISGAAELAAVASVMAVALIIEDLPRAYRQRTTALHTFGRTASPDGDG